MPDDQDIENIFATIAGDMVIAMTQENFYYPVNNINTIVNWEQHSAYKMKMANGAILNIQGHHENNKNITLPAGWSLLPVISQCNVDVEDLFSPVVSDLEIVKDIAGAGVYWPQMNINTIGELLPGKAYFVKMSEAGIVDFTDFTPIPAFPLEGEGDGRRTGSPLLLKEKGPGVEVIKTPSTHTIAILPEALKGFEPGTIIAACDQNGNCFGAAAYSHENLSLTVFGDDPTTEEKDGFNKGEVIIFKNLSGLENLTGLHPTFDQSLSHTDGLFTENGLSAITGFKFTTGISENSFSNAIHIYPNPSSGEIFIEGFEPGSTITIMDMQGQEVFEKTLLENDVQQIGLEHLDPGAYMVIIKNELKRSSHKLILK
jgi:hypothetical protein